MARISDPNPRYPAHPRFCGPAVATPMYQPAVNFGEAWISAILVDDSNG